MKRKNIVIALMLVCLLIVESSAQKRPKINIWNPPVQKGITTLKVGDIVPDFKLANIFNDKIKNAALSDYKDQLLILDFGNTGCSGCVAALPLMEALQKEFGKQVKIFWVTPQYYEDVAEFWKANKYTRNNTLPTVVEDSTARAYFKHKGWPHEAWIYKGKVIAITGPEYVDAANIKKVLSGEVINWPVKNDFYTFNGLKQSLFKLDSNQIDTKSTVIEYAAISGYIEGRSQMISGTPASAIVRDPLKKTVRFYITNYPIYNAYILQFLKLLKSDKLIKPSPSLILAPNEITWEVANRSRYIYDKKYGYPEDWKQKNAICFESLNPDTGQTDTDIYRTVIADMNSLLKLNVRWEKRKEKVLVLVRTGSIDKLKSKGKITYDEKLGDWSSPRYMQKGTLYQFRDSGLPIAEYMNKQESNPYVFDETGFPDPHFIDMDLDIPSWTDIPAIRKAIASYDLDLKEEERLVDRLVFSEKRRI